MNNITNKWMLVAFALMAAGVIGFTFIMTIAGWDFKSIGSSKYKANTVQIKDDFRNISIITDTEDITFVLSSDGKCSIEFYEHEKVKPDVSVKNGTLTIGTEDTRKWFEQISLFFNAPKITVFLPQKEYGSLAVEESTGDIILPGDFEFGSISIRTSTGNVSCGASSEGLTRINTGTGSIRAADFTTGELDLSVSTGKIELHSVRIEGNIHVSVSTGKTMLKDVSCEDLLSEGSTGDLTLENVIAKGKMVISRSTGDVEFDQSDAAEISVQTSTGNVTGSLLSDKIFITKSDTGRIEVPESLSGGKCSITTDTGKIIITVK